MAALGNTPTEIEEWIIKTMDSCTTLQQVVRSRRLIDLYFKKLSNETELCYEIRLHLKDNLLKHYKSAKLRLISDQRESNPEEDGFEVALSDFKNSIKK